jgi:hypothetical protein
MSVKKKQFFLIKNLELFLEPFVLEPTKAKSHLMMYLHELQFYRHKNKSSPFQEKK